MRVFNELLRHLPDRLGRRPRSAWLTRRARAFGPESSISRGSRVLGPENLVVGRGVSVARDVTLDARGGLSIGDGALIGFETLLLTHTHLSPDPTRPVQEQGMYGAPVVIGARAWLGARVIVLPGVSIGAEAIVGAGAVVTRDVEARAIVVGSPARQIGTRSTSEATLPTS